MRQGVYGKCSSPDCTTCHCAKEYIGKLEWKARESDDTANLRAIQVYLWHADGAALTLIAHILNLSNSRVSILNRDGERLVEQVS